MRVCGQRRVPADLLPGKRPVSIVQEAEWASEPVCMGRKISPSAGFELRAVKPVPSRYGDYAIPVALNSSVDGKIRCCIAHTHTHTHTHTQNSPTKRRNSVLVIIRRFITDITRTSVTLSSDSSIRFTSSQGTSIYPVTDACRYVVWRHVRLTNIDCHDIWPLFITNIRLELTHSNKHPAYQLATLENELHK